MICVDLIDVCSSDDVFDSNDVCSSDDVFDLTDAPAPLKFLS